MGSQCCRLHQQVITSAHLVFAFVGRGLARPCAKVGDGVRARGLEPDSER
jgi:hypothetical protein